MVVLIRIPLNVNEIEHLSKCLFVILLRGQKREKRQTEIVGGGVKKGEKCEYKAK